MHASENFSSVDAVKHTEVSMLHHAVNLTNPSEHKVSGTNMTETAALVKSGFLPHVDFQDDKHPKKKDAGHGTTHSGGHGPDLKNVHITKKQGDLITGVLTTVIPGGGLIKAGAPYAVDGIKKLIHKQQQHSDKNHSDKSHSDKTHTDKSHPDDPLHKFKEEGKKGPLHTIMKKFHLTKS